MAEAIDPSEVVGEHVRVHYNLHRCKRGRDPKPGESCWVVKTKRGGKWLVAGYVEGILLEDVTFKVSKAGVKRIRRTGDREVIAWFEGIVADANSKHMKRAIGGGDWEGVGFNPFEGDSFYLYDSDEEVEYAPLAYVSGRKAIALLEMPNPGDAADDPEEYLEALVDELGADVTGDGEEDELEENPAPDLSDKDLRKAVADHWIKEGFYRGRSPIFKLFDGDPKYGSAWHEITPEMVADPPWEWISTSYMDAWAPLARAVIFTEHGTPKPYDQGAYHDKLDAVLEPLGYKHYIVNDAVVVIMIDPYSEEGEAIMDEAGF
jgi:hypothetical protein